MIESQVSDREYRIQVSGLVPGAVPGRLYMLPWSERQSSWQTGDQIGEEEGLGEHGWQKMGLARGRVTNKRYQKTRPHICLVGHSGLSHTNMRSRYGRGFSVSDESKFVAQEKSCTPDMRNFPSFRDIDS